MSSYTHLIQSIGSTSLNFHQFLQEKGESFYVFLGLPVPICMKTSNSGLFFIQELVLVTYAWYHKSFREGSYIDGLLRVVAGAGVTLS